MSKRTVSTPVTAKTIRQAFQSGALDPAKVVNAKGDAVNPACLFSGPQGKGRGRLNPAFVAAFLDANPGTTYAEKVAEVKMVEVPLTSPKTGRPIKPVSLPISEVRTLAGVAGKKGRLSQADLTAAAKAYQAK
jgi:hypothetical protein